MNDQAPGGRDSNEITNDSIVVHHSHGSSCEGKLDGCKKKKKQNSAYRLIKDRMKSML